MNLFKKFILLWKKPKIAVVISDNQEMVKNVISQILGRSFRIEEEVLFVDDLEEKDLSTKKYLILNFDDGNIQKLKEKTLAKVLTFGFKEGADFQASDIKINDRTNFNNAFTIWNPTAGTTILIDHTSGNVGFGVTNPSERLDINGNIRLTGNIISPNDICIGSCP